VSRYKFELSGGRLCLDFANTVESRPTERRRDLLESYADLAAWSRASRILSPADERALLRRAHRSPARAARVLRQARSLREALFAAFAHRSRTAVDEIQKELPRAYRRPILRRFHLLWGDDPRSLDGMLGPVLRSAVELLTSEELERVRVCGAEDCDWLFLDESRSRSRQWCNMASCGNRAKARRFYRRHRGRRNRGR
jgi:predicted RNA-binding Zn ribbon-like protein